MGDIADMVLEGLLDEETGEYIGDRNLEEYGFEAPGFPVSYERDSESFDIPFIHEIDELKKRQCPMCSKKVSPVGLYDHINKRHGHVISVTYELGDGSKVVARSKKWSFFKD
jgi:hypothetical protein